MIKCILVDDEPLAREGLATYVKQIDFLDLRATCKSALAANSVLQKEQIDLMFLDIEMPGLSGLEFLRSLAHSPLIVFTTAYPNYALEGYQFEAVDYLVKPISFERFLQAVNKVQRLLHKNKSGENAPEEDSIFVKTDKQLIRLKIADIQYVEGMQNYIVFHTKKEKLMTLVPLKNLFELLPEGLFIQVHKSYVVAKSKIEAIVGNQIHIGDKRVPISVRLRKKVVDELTKDRILKK